MPNAGCRISSGPQPFQILQRDATGSAIVELAGSWDPVPDEANPQVVVRVLHEVDGSVAADDLDWQPAETMTDGTWRWSGAVPSGGLYRVETGVSAGRVEWARRGDVIHHIGVGDLWIIAGQSNAAGYGRGPIFDPPELGIHVLRNDGRWSIATHPLNDPTGNDNANEEPSNPGHSPFVAFGRLLRHELGIPIGFVQAARGASGMDSWNPVRTPAALYRNMVRRIGLAGGRAAGLVWHQGEGEGEWPELAPTYGAQLRELVDSLRRDLDQPDLPVLVPQINRYVVPTDDEAIDRAWSIVREQQRRAGRAIPGVIVVPTLDLPLSDLIHNGPAGNLVLAQRLFRAALGLVHDRPLHFLAPDLVEAQLSADGDLIRLRFENVSQRLHWDVPGTAGLVVEDDEGVVALGSLALEAPSVLALTVARPIVGAARVHSAFGRNPPAGPYDVGNGWPALGFHDVPVTPPSPR